jgi:putative pantetheine hydrolase
LKGGLGTASVRLPDGTTVGALVAVNSVGSTVDSSGRLLGERHGLGAEFAGLATPVEPAPEAPPGPLPGMNTVIAAVATDVPLDKAAAKRMAMIAHDGLARAIDPVHTLVDGDTIFALSTAPVGRPRLSVTDASALVQLETVFAAAASTLTRAIVSAVLAAESVETPAGRLLSYRAAYPSAFPAGSPTGRLGGGPGS